MIKLFLASALARCMQALAFLIDPLASADAILLVTREARKKMAVASRASAVSWLLGKYYAHFPSESSTFARCLCCKAVAVAEKPASENGLCVPAYYMNRNPCNLEILGLQPKRYGFQTSRDRVDFYYRLRLQITTRFITGVVQHTYGDTVVSASSKERCIKHFLYSAGTVNAAYNVGRVLAHRCRQTGIHRMMWERRPFRKKNQKMAAFVRGVCRGGVLLNEKRNKALNMAQPKAVLKWW